MYSFFTTSTHDEHELGSVKILSKSKLLFSKNFDFDLIRLVEKYFVKERNCEQFEALHRINKRFYPFPSYVLYKDEWLISYPHK